MVMTDLATLFIKIILRTVYRNIIEDRKENLELFPTTVAKIFVISNVPNLGMQNTVIGRFS
jgi:hypothetical protein